VNESSITHFLLGRISASVIVNSGVISIQPSAGEFADVNNKKLAIIGIVILAMRRFDRGQALLNAGSEV
jgi:hypothetical protein